MGIPVLELQRKAIDTIKARFGLLAGGSALVTVLGSVISSIVMSPFMLFYFVVMVGWMAGITALDSAGVGEWAVFGSLALVYIAMYALIWVGSLAGTAAAGPLYAGYLRMGLSLNEGGEPALDWVFKGFKAFWKWFGAMLWVLLWVFLWSLLFVVPGIIKALSYSMTLPLMAEHPDLTVKDAMKLSMRMTEGYKGGIFVAMLLLYAWALISILLACTIVGPIVYAVLWVTPLSLLIMMGVYRHVKDSALSRGVVTDTELGRRSLEES